MLCLVVVFGCGDNLQLAIDTPPAEPDAFVKLDAAIDAPPAPATIMISGTATERTLSGTVRVAGATIAAFANSNESLPLTTTVTNSQGNFVLVVTTGGIAISGFLKATKAGLKDTYLYPATFIDDDIALVPMQMLSPANYDALSTLTQGNQMNQNGLIALQVLDGPPPAGTPVEDAVVASIPAAGAYKYNSMQGLPDSLATDTHSDGVAYMFNVPVGSVDVMATKAGSTFATTSLKTWPDALTTTFIQPP
jgi:hypothetical protein